MPRSLIITTSVEVLIASVHREHPKWKAPIVRNEVDRVLHKDNPGLPFGWPGLSTVQKVLAIVRKQPDDDQEKPWSTASLDSYPISPEALPVVLKIWKLRIGEREHLTIREAKWVVQLSALEQDTKKLFLLASRHARTELMFKIIDKPFDSTELDRLLMGFEVGISDFKSFLWLLAEQREDKERGIEDGVKQVQEKVNRRQAGNKKGGTK